MILQRTLEANDSNCVGIGVLRHPQAIEISRDVADMENRMLGNVLVKVEICDEVVGRESGRQSCAVIDVVNSSSLILVRL